MPKSLDKTKGAQKRNSSANTPAAATASNGDAGAAGPVPKKKKVQKKKTFSLDDGIEMSKQLAGKVRKARTSRPVRSTFKNSAPRVCGNGVPMPSLADLEKMYEDSDYDTDADEKPTIAPTVPSPPDRCTTPDSKIPILPPEKLMSPNTLKNIASKVYQILETGAIEILDDDGPPPPVIPQKRPKKSEVPYIVGCKDRPQIPPGPSKTRIGVGDTKYGVECPCESSDDECQDCPKKRRRRGDGATISKSIFNPKSEEIAANLKANECLEQLLFWKKSSSPDSCSTVSYECTVSPAPRPFSPIPSCSNDSATILQNDKLYNESLIGEDLCNDSQNDIEILEVPIETIDVLDEPTIVKPKTEPVPVNEDDFCMIIEPEKENVSLIDLDEPKYDFYNNINTLDLNENYENDICEIIDVDDIIAENQALINKYKKEDNVRDVVTSVDLTNVGPSPEQMRQNTVDDVVISSNTSDRTVGNPSTPITPVSNFPSTPVGDTTRSSRDNLNNSSNKIAEVVNNFFNKPTNNNSCETVDLTSRGASILDKISSITSWISTIDNFIRGQSTPRAPQTDSRSQTIDNSVIDMSSPGPSAPVNTNYGIGPTVTIRHSNNMPRSQPLPLNIRATLHKTRANPVVPRNTTAKQPVTVLHRTQAVQQTQVVPQQSAAAPVPQQPMSPVTPQARGRGIDCPICMDSMSNSSIASTMCGHVFCMECIKASIRANGKRCPTCRKQLKGVGYHQLFL